MNPKQLDQRAACIADAISNAASRHAKTPDPAAAAGFVQRAGDLAAAEWDRRFPAVTLAREPDAGVGSVEDLRAIISTETSSSARLITVPIRIINQHAGSLAVEMGRRKQPDAGAPDGAVRAVATNECSLHRVPLIEIDEPAETTSIITDDRVVSRKESAERGRVCPLCPEGVRRGLSVTVPDARTGEAP